MATDNTSSERPHKLSDEDWKHHRETIQRLYIEENRSLWDVMNIMAERYGFKARYVDLIF